MRCEIPTVRRCCCCLPLRNGLLMWAYFKQICSVLSLLFFIFKVYETFEYEMSEIGYIIFGTAITAEVVDVAFHVVFIIGAHKKDYKKIRLFYRYSIIILSLFVACIFFIVGAAVYVLLNSPFFIIIIYYTFLPFIGISFMFIVIHIYLIILVRSEFIKLKNNSQFEFVNTTAEEKCTANIDFMKENELY